LTYHVSDSERPGFPAAQGQLQRFDVAKRWTIGTSRKRIRNDSLNSQFSLALGELLGVCGEVKKNEVCAEGPTSSHCTLNDKQPTPSLKTTFSVKMAGDPSCDQTPEGT